MAVIDIVAMKAALAPGGRLFGLDIGSKTIGIAVSDSALKVASPFDSAAPGKFAGDMAKLQALIAERGDRRPRARPAYRLGWQRGPALPVGAPVRRQSAGRDRPAARLLGRALLDARRRAADAGGGDVPSPPGRARSTSWPRPISCRVPSTGIAAANAARLDGRPAGMDSRPPIPVSPRGSLSCPARSTASASSISPASWRGRPAPSSSAISAPM